MNIKTKIAKNGVLSTVNLALHKNLILKTKERSQIRVMELKKVTYGQMERHYEGSHILFLESSSKSMSLQICISLFTIYSGSNICDLVKS